VPFDGCPVFQLSPRGSYRLVYAPLLSQTYVTFRVLTATLSAVRREGRDDRELRKAAARHYTRGATCSVKRQIGPTRRQPS